MSNVVSFGRYPRRGTTPVRIVIHHRASQSFVEFIDPSRHHKIPVSGAEAFAFEEDLSRHIGNEHTVIVRFLESLTGG